MRRTQALLAVLVLTANTSQERSGPWRPTGPHHQDVDYVVVGGGVAGLVVAEQLSQNPKLNIVVLEAGLDATNEPLVNIPAYGPRLSNTHYMWNFTTLPDPGLDGARPPLPQGRGWGGGSQVNYMMYCRGSSSVFDEWAEISGDKGLRWENLLQHFRATTHYEKQDIGYDPHLEASAYGDGPLEVTSNRDNLDFFPNFANALKEELNLPTVDFNAGAGLGVSTGPSTIRASNRTRHYALPAFGWQMADRPNVQMIHDAWVSKISFSGKRATSVTYHPTDGSIHTICAREIILAAGAINSPKLLMLSGVGPKEHLRDLNIPLVADHPLIGSHLYDHHYSFLEYEVTPDVPTAWQLNHNVTFSAAATRQYVDHGNGPLGTLSGSFGIAKFPLSSCQLTYPDRGHLLYQAVLAGKLPPPSPNISLISPFVALIQPESYGSVRLSSRDYADDPQITSNYYGTDRDKSAILYGYKQLRKIMSSRHVSRVIVREIFPGENVTTDAELWEAVKRSARTFHHPVGTVALGRVLDAKWRVKGLEGLRVVDSSALPTVPTCHLQGTVYAVAHHVAGVIRREDGWMDG